MKKEFKSFADAKRRVEQGASIEFTHLAESSYSGPTHVLSWDRRGFIIKLKFVPPGASYPGMFIAWPAKASEFDAATGTIFKDGQPAFLVKLR